MLPLRFADPADYDKIREDDRVSIRGLAALAPGRPVTVVLHHGGGTEETIQCQHSFTTEQLAWFRAGAALNLLREE
jgi:aconitate hydratase